MDISVQCGNPVHNERLNHHDWGLLLVDPKLVNSTIEESSVADIGRALETALVLLSNSTPSLDSSEGCSTASQEQSSLDLVNTTCKSTMPHPSAPKLVSAMKGSRRKLGLFVEKLCVTWAPDVYDPPPTSSSHSVTSCKQQHSGNSKSYRHKGKVKSGRNSRTRKKQHHKSLISSSIR